MSLPNFFTQAELFSTAAISASLFAPTDRYRLFAKWVYPPLAGSRATLGKCYCADNGRVAIEPVLLLGVSLLQDLLARGVSSYLWHLLPFLGFPVHTPPALDPGHVTKTGRCLIMAYYHFVLGILWPQPVSRASATTRSAAG